MDTIEIKITGCVQGVGFRPFVCRLAQQYGLSGFVQNTVGSVLIRAAGAGSKLKPFIHAVQTQYPAQASIHSFTCNVLSTSTHSSDETHHAVFYIKDSTENIHDVFVPKDMAPCDVCKHDMTDSSNRRFNYAFTSCCDCGPRFSILKKLPFDRDKTSLIDYPMCSACLEEYSDLTNRRFHAQTTCCEVCGPQLRFDSNKDSHLEKSPLDRAVHVLKKGGVLLLKGVGGYQYLALLTQKSAVDKIKALKSRNTKPFAIMLKDFAMADKLVELSEAGKKSLLSPYSPIVLAKKKILTDNTFIDKKTIESISEDTADLGVMLPSSSLHFLLMEKLNTAVICTSANLPGENMLIDDQQAFSLLNNIDGMLWHERKIQHKLDDSIVKDMGSHVLTMRLGRGLAPLQMPIQQEQIEYLTHETIVAMGAQQKSTFSLYDHQYLTLSQHNGDLHYLNAIKDYETNLTTFQDLYHQTKISHVSFDQHPDFHSSKVAQQYDAHTISIQHHRAHILSCAAQHQESLKPTAPIMALVLDGYGYGDDKSAWGGEIFFGDLTSLQHISGLDRVVSLGEKSVSEPWRMCMAYLIAAQIPLSEIETLLPIDRDKLAFTYQVINNHKPNNSSLGRLLDSISVLLRLIPHHIEYESQGPMVLEKWAELSSHEDRYDFCINQSGRLDFTLAFRQCKDELLGRLGNEYHVQHLAHKQAAYIARKWMNTLIKGLCNLLVTQLHSHKTKTILLSGGCMQNRLLHHGLVSELQGSDLTVLTHSSIPCNDAGISAGQAYGAALQMKRGQLCA